MSESQELLPKWRQCFVKIVSILQKAKNFVYFGPYDFVQILPACGPNTYQIMYGETLDFQYQSQQWLHIM